MRARAMETVKVSELILYTSEDGQTQLHLRAESGSVWLTQLETAELLQTTKQNVSLHARNIFEDGELTAEATVKDSLTVRTEGSREVQRKLTQYNMDLILAIGYRVRSPWCSVPPVGKRSPEGVLAQGQQACVGTLFISRASVGEITTVCSGQCTMPACYF